MKLLLEDGTEFEGLAFGADRPVVGEVVFTTAMSGYVETLTDPSFRGQILVLTYPLAGNYGVPAPRPPGSIDAPYESSQIQVQGLVVEHAIGCPSHYASPRTLGDWLMSEGVPAITGIDTRSLNSSASRARYAARLPGSRQRLRGAGKAGCHRCRDAARAVLPGRAEGADPAWR